MLSSPRRTNDIAGFYLEIVIVDVAFGGRSFITDKHNPRSIELGEPSNRRRVQEGLLLALRSQPVQGAFFACEAAHVSIGDDPGLQGIQLPVTGCPFTYRNIGGGRVKLRAAWGNQNLDHGRGCRGNLSDGLVPA